MTTNLKKQVYNEYVQNTSIRIVTKIAESIKECKKLVRVIKTWDGRDINQDLIKSLKSLKSFKGAEFEFCSNKGLSTIRERKHGLYDALQFDIYGGNVVDAKETIKDIKYKIEWYEFLGVCWYHICHSFDYKDGEHDEFLSMMSKPGLKNWYNCLLKYQYGYVALQFQAWGDKWESYKKYREGTKAA